MVPFLFEASQSRIDLVFLAFLQRKSLSLMAMMRSSVTHASTEPEILCVTKGACFSATDFTFSLNFLHASSTILVVKYKTFY